MSSFDLDRYGILTAEDGGKHSVVDVCSIVELLGRDKRLLAGRSWFLLNIADWCENSKLLSLAETYIEAAIECSGDPVQKSDCILALGQFHERCGNYTAAVRAYSRAFVLQQGEDDTWYFLNNNLGYSLNRLVRFEEAEGFCRAAIRIDPRRYNAYKNLGVSLQGQRKHPEAANLFFISTRICPRDGRALRQLEELVASDPSLVRDHPLVRKRLQESRRLAKEYGLGWSDKDP